MKQIITIAILIIAFLSVDAQKVKTVTITGKVIGDTKGSNYIMYYTSSNPLDSVPIIDGKFTLTLPFAETYTQLFVSQYDFRVKRSYRPFPLLIDGTGDIHIEMDILKGFYESNITGSTTAVAFFSFIKQQNVIYKTISEKVVSLYGKSYVPQSDPLADKMSISRDSLTNLYMGSMINEFVNAHKDEYVGIYVLSTAGQSAMSLNMLEHSFSLLPNRYKSSVEGKKLQAYINGVKNTNVGATIKNFILKNQEGKNIDFKQFKGKYVWIDFWASWCGPCKQAFPHMKELYAKYKDKGFEILGISTDTKIDPWLKILPTLQNPWPQVWDNKNIMFEFAVTAFPTSFLIDPNGVILLREIGYTPGGQSPMDIKLKEIFETTSTKLN